MSNMFSLMWNNSIKSVKLQRLTEHFYLARHFVLFQQIRNNLIHFYPPVNRLMFSTLVSMAQLVDLAITNFSIDENISEKQNYIKQKVYFKKIYLGDYPFLFHFNFLLFKIESCLT